MLNVAVITTITISVLMYGSDTWALRKAKHNLLERTDNYVNGEMDDGNKAD